MKISLIAHRLPSLATCVFSTALLAASHATAAEEIVNGGFEDPKCQTAGQICPPWGFKNNAAINDDGHAGSKHGATVGGQGGGTGVVTQKLTLTKGYYVFSFWYKATGTVSGSTPAIVRFTGATIRTVFTVMIPPVAQWIKYEQFLIVDQDGETTIEFSSENPPHFAGPYFNIDDVSLVH
ncbi:hypothetical protein GOD03_11820 [Sinorhizobium medicae]|nr:hypothetical protein [Sinorhizobium medicae]MDX0651759.1 hypothetical protein [Sinorhizobium medicae]MDX0700923.1 hypothetical protein [Sinorhizobium medicae]